MFFRHIPFLVCFVSFVAQAGLEDYFIQYLRNGDVERMYGMLHAYRQPLFIEKAKEAFLSDTQLALSHSTIKQLLIDEPTRLIESTFQGFQLNELVLNQLLSRQIIPTLYWIRLCVDLDSNRSIGTPIANAFWNHRNHRSHFEDWKGYLDFLSNFLQLVQTDPSEASQFLNDISAIAIDDFDQITMDNLNALYPFWKWLQALDQKLQKEPMINHRKAYQKLRIELGKKNHTAIYASRIVNLSNRDMESMAYALSQDMQRGGYHGWHASGYDLGVDTFLRNHFSTR